LKGSLSTRLIIWVGVPAALLFALVVTVSALRSYTQVSENGARSSRAIARHRVARLETVLRRAQEIPEMMAIQLESGALDTEEKLTAYMRAVLERNRGQVYGSCIAFTPSGFRSDLNAYGPYYYWSKEGLQFEQLAKPDYNYFQWDWYRRPRDAGRPVWSAPYFDEGGGQTLMITYSVPIWRDGLFWAIITVDIELAEMLNDVGAMSDDERETVGSSAYAFIIDKDGKYLAFPQESPEHVQEHSLQEKNTELASAMLSGKEGVMRTVDPRDGKQAWVAYAPILINPMSEDSDNAPLAEMSLAIVSAESPALDAAQGLFIAQVAIGLAGLALLFLAIIVVARSISRPIRELADAARQIADGNLELNIATGSRTDEVQLLENGFNKMTKDLRMQMQELRYTTTLRERMEGELTAARNIQMSLLPKIFPAFPDHPEIDVHAMVRPAREVGGDFYDFFLLDNERLCVALGDVAGKGVPAALFMAVSKSLIKATALAGHAADEIVARVNDELCEEADAGMFVTLLFAILNTVTGELEYCNAGHLSPFLLGPGETIKPLGGARAPALALATGLAFPTVRYRLAPGDAVFFFTDGVTEALSPERDFYTPERLEDVLRVVRMEPVGKITRAVMNDVRTFCAEREQADDISVMALRWLGAPHDSPPESSQSRETQPAHELKI